MSKLLLNCDLGEWETPERTRELMQYLDIASIACGGHAGGAESIVYSAGLARHYNVLTGAHPGMPDGGRGSTRGMTASQFKSIVSSQIETYLTTGAELHHIKLHGSLYHLSENDPEICSTYLEIVAEHHTAALCIAGGSVAQAAKQRTIPFISEAFIDRGYKPNGQLVPRGSYGDLITLPGAVVSRILQLAVSRRTFAFDGTQFDIFADTACVHSDSENSLYTLRIARTYLDALDEP